MSRRYLQKPPIETLLLVLVVLLGVGLRFYGLYWDRPYYFNPDEKRLIEWGMAFSYLDPGASEWGTLPLILIRIITVLFSLVDEPETLDISFIARLVAAGIGCLTLGLVYFLSRSNFGRRTALIATLFSVVTVLLIQDAHFYSLDGFFTALVLLAFFPILAIARTGRKRAYILAGLFIGLTGAVRLNGFFLILPLIVAHVYSYHVTRNRPAEETGIDWIKGFIQLPATRDLLLAIVFIFSVFFLLTPGAILDTGNYLFHDGLVWILLQSSGHLKSRYTLQFEGTTPLFYFTNLLYWAAGPLLLLAYFVSIGHALFRWRQARYIVILSFVLLYLWLGAGARVKFIRYTLVLLPLLNILAADMFVRLHTTFTKQTVLRTGIAVWLLVTIILTGQYALAFTTIYARPDPRILAGQWIREHIPAGATIARESNDYQTGLVDFNDEAAPVYRLQKINFDKLYESSRPAMESRFPPIIEQLGVDISRRGKDRPQPESFTPLTDAQKQQSIGEKLYCSDYIIFTERNYALYRERGALFPVEQDYYARLFNHQLGFQLIKTFERRPSLLGWELDDSGAELTFRLFDHPMVWIFQAQPPINYIVQHPPHHQVAVNWDNKAGLAGYDLDAIALEAGRSLQFTLYWQPLANMTSDYTIFVHLSDQDGTTIAQNDHQVADGILPTSCWQPGRIIVDSTSIQIPPDTSPGTYQLKLGLYSPETLDRLPIIQDTSGEQTFQLADIEILAAE